MRTQLAWLVAAFLCLVSGPVASGRQERAEAGVIRGKVEVKGDRLILPRGVKDKEPLSLDVSEGFTLTDARGRTLELKGAVMIITWPPGNKNRVPVAVSRKGGKFDLKVKDAKFQLDPIKKGDRIVEVRIKEKE
jgi:hypothetical protein